MKSFQNVATKLLHFSHHMRCTSDFVHSFVLNKVNQKYIVNTCVAEKCNTNTLDFLHTSDIYRKTFISCPVIYTVQKNVVKSLHNVHVIVKKMDLNYMQQQSQWKNVGFRQINKSVKYVDADILALTLN